MEDLVAGLPRDPEPPAKRRHLLAIQGSGHESRPFIRLATLFHGTLLSPAKGEKCYPCARNQVLPISREAHGYRPVKPPCRPSFAYGSLRARPSGSLAGVAGFGS
jgi:hypothetical protein